MAAISARLNGFDGNVMEQKSNTNNSQLYLLLNYSGMQQGAQPSFVDTTPQTLHIFLHAMQMRRILI